MVAKEWVGGWLARQNVCMINVTKLFKYFHVFAAMMSMMMIPALEEGGKRRKKLITIIKS